MATGRKPLPTKLKVVKGTARVDRINPAEPKPSTSPLLVPVDLPRPAVPHFETLRARLQGIGLDSATYTETLCLAARRMAEIEDCTAFLDERGSPTYETKTAKDGYMVRAYPEVAMRSDAMRHLHSLLAEMGLTPSAIGRVGAKAPEKPKGKWEKFAK